MIYLLLSCFTIPCSGRPFKHLGMTPRQLEASTGSVTEQQTGIVLVFACMSLLRMGDFDGFEIILTTHPFIH